MAHLREEADKLEAKGLNLERAFVSGEPGTTGREPFEDSTASGPGPRFASGNVGESGHHHHQHQHHQHSEHTGAGATGLGAGGLAGAGAGAGGLSSMNQGLDRDPRRQDSGAGDYKTFEQTGQQKMDAAASGGYTGSATGNPEAGEGKRHEKDRVGDLQQDSHLYERSGQSGPATHGAAGTDRFDTHSTGVHQGDSNPGARREEGEVDRRGEGKGTGGVMGVLGTTDKEFTARDRLGKGAYHDDDAHFKANTSGPGGNTALTGREGNQENNPVAQAKSRQGEDVNDVHKTSGERVGHADHPEHQKKGIVEKIKEKISS